MDYETITTKIVERIYPTGFLEQLGELLKRPVGLGEIRISNGGMIDIEAPVLVQDAELGEYGMQERLGIYRARIFRDKSGIFSINYDGRHPLAYGGEKTISLTYARIGFGGTLFRGDWFDQIVFPFEGSKRHGDPMWNYIAGLR